MGNELLYFLTGASLRSPLGPHFEQNLVPMALGSSGIILAMLSQSDQFKLQVQSFGQCFAVGPGTFSASFVCAISPMSFAHL